MSARERLDEIQQRADAATEGPWVTWTGLDPDGTRREGISPERDIEVDICETPRTPDGREDAEFIAHARQDVPALVGALRAVLDEIKRAEDLVRQSTPPKTAEALIRNGDAPKVSTGSLRRAITDALGGEQA